MTRFLSILALIVGLLALAAPSASVGMGVSGPVWTLGDIHVSASTPETPALVVNCKSLGGKRVLPCHPDLGVLAAAVSITAPPDGFRLALRIMPPLTITAPEAELPPPRLV